MSLIKKILNNDILCIIYTPFIRSNFQSNVVAIYMVCPQPMFLPNTLYFICNELVSVLLIFLDIFLLCVSLIIIQNMVRINIFINIYFIIPIFPEVFIFV